MRRFVEGQSLEVAEHDRQPKWSGQAVDLAMEDLGLLAGQDLLLGWLPKSEKDGLLQFGQGGRVTKVRVIATTAPFCGASP